jgi:transposase-like protein
MVPAVRPDEADDMGRLRCPFCEAYEIDRLYLASMRVDSCICSSCGARWDEDTSTGEYRGRQSHARTSRTDAR